MNTCNCPRSSIGGHIYLQVSGKQTVETGEWQRGRKDRREEEQALAKLIGLALMCQHMQTQKYKNVFPCNLNLKSDPMALPVPGSDSGGAGEFNGIGSGGGISTSDIDCGVVVLVMLSVWWW